MRGHTRNVVITNITYHDIKEVLSVLKKLEHESFEYLKVAFKQSFAVGNIVLQMEGPTHPQIRNDCETFIFMCYTTDDVDVDGALFTSCFTQFVVMNCSSFLSPYL